MFHGVEIIKDKINSLKNRFALDPSPMQSTAPKLMTTTITSSTTSKAKATETTPHATLNRDKSVKSASYRKIQDNIGTPELAHKPEMVCKPEQAKNPEVANKPKMAQIPEMALKPEDADPAIISIQLAGISDSTLPLANKLANGIPSRLTNLSTKRSSLTNYHRRRLTLRRVISQDVNTKVISQEVSENAVGQEADSKTVR